MGRSRRTVRSESGASLFGDELAVMGCVSLRPAALPSALEIAPVVQRYVVRCGVAERARLPVGLMQVIRDSMAAWAAPPPARPPRARFVVEGTTPPPERAVAPIELSPIAVLLLALVTLGVAFVAFLVAAHHGQL